jgi:hypothetical protein
MKFPFSNLFKDPDPFCKREESDALPESFVEMEIYFLVLQISVETSELYRSLSAAVDYLAGSDWNIQLVVSNLLIAFKKIDPVDDSEEGNELAEEVRTAIAECTGNRFSGCLNRFHTSFLEVRGGGYATFTFLNPGILNALKLLEACPTGKITLSS